MQCLICRYCIYICDVNLTNPTTKLRLKMNNPNVKFGKPALSEFPDSFSSFEKTNRAVCSSHFESEGGSPAFSSLVVPNESALSSHAENLPFKRYVDSLGDPVRRSMLLAQVQLETGKHPSTIDRYLYGVTRPDGQNRRAIAFVVGKHTGCTLSGDELFPAAYPYSGRIRRSDGRMTLRQNKSEVCPGSARPSCSASQSGERGCSGSESRFTASRSAASGFRPSVHGGVVSVAPFCSETASGAAPGFYSDSEPLPGGCLYSGSHSCMVACPISDPGSPLETRLSSRAEPLYESRPACGSQASSVC